MKNWARQLKRKSRKRAERQQNISKTPENEREPVLITVCISCRKQGVCPAGETLRGNIATKWIQ